MPCNNVENQSGGKRVTRRRSSSPKPVKRAASPKRKTVKRRGGECGCDKANDNVANVQNQEGGKKKKSVKKTGAKRPPNKWILALKEFNKGKKNWEVPKKGTSAYDEVRKIMAKL